MLDRLGQVPVIVRSSSQLEDSFGTSFAGKYDSYFCPNQGTRPENLRALTQAIALTYASTLKPDALLYRRSKGLQDYDERMAILIQEVQGERLGKYFLPQGAGVAFSRNLYRWDPKIRREAGFMRLVWGLGTRAVERVGNDYPRLVALSHPLLQPDDSPEAIRGYSQQYVDLIDMEANEFKTLPIHAVLQPEYPALRYLTQIEEEGYFSSLRGRVRSSEIDRLAITYTEYLRRTPFAKTMNSILRLLEKDYHSAVDIEFTVQIQDPTHPQPDIRLSLLQCRPQSHLQLTRTAQIPPHLTDKEIVFSTQFMVPQGYVPICVTSSSSSRRILFSANCLSAQRSRAAGVSSERKTAAKVFSLCWAGSLGNCKFRLGSLCILLRYPPFGRAGGAVRAWHWAGSRAVSGYPFLPGLDGSPDLPPGLIPGPPGCSLSTATFSTTPLILSRNGFRSSRLWRLVSS
jgi:hypothetical protein